MITAPYNFVPLNKEIFYPSWSEQVSHDVPFSDGESGEIEITITAKSPIFIRNHSDDKEKSSSEFCHFINENGAKEFYIPASSMKGMIRSVLEIMSFSKMRIDEAKLSQYLSVRDMTNQKQLVGSANGCGFLVKDGDSYQIEDCGKILTISHYDLQTNCQGIKKLESAKSKYEKFGTNQIKFKTFTKMMDVRGKQIPKTMATFDNASSKSGTLVFTGDIGNKKHEFVFSKNGVKINLQNRVFQKFSKVYFENEESVDGAYWRSKWKDSSTKIPVFYIKQNDKIEAIGLTQLFKLAYNKTLFDAAKQDSNPNKLDLAETIFGTQKEKLALKGRVQFSHFKSTLQRYESFTVVEQVLGSPNPTYYPNYIRQTDTNDKKVNNYITLMNANAEVSGWKRYPLQQTIQNYPLPKNEQGKINHDVATKFKPLESGSTFSGKLRFHNLKKAEIGALLSAITFHGQNSTHMHNLGMAKSLGYGKIDIQLTFKNLKYSQKEYLDGFEDEMTKELPNWKNSSQLKELFAMAYSNCKEPEDLKYQLLENPKPKYEREKNDFTGAKKAREYLLPHSGTKIVPQQHASAVTTKETSPVQAKPNATPQKNSGLNIVHKKAPPQSEDDFKELYKKFDNNIVQIASALKAGQFDKQNINKKALVKKLLEEMKKDEKLWKSQKVKDLERKQFLEDMSQ